MSPQVNYWAEALGGSLVQRAHALAARGGNPFRDQVVSKRVGPHAPRATHFDKSIAWGARSDEQIAPRQGPEALGTAKPRVVLQVMNLDSFSRRDRHKSGTIADLMLDAVKRFNPEMVVVDESHKIKGAGSNVSRLLGRIGETVRRRAILTGTVMPSGPMDVYAQWRFLQPFAFGLRQKDGTIRRATYGSFRDRFALMGGYMGKQIVGYRDLDDMQAIMAENAVVALKKDCLDLPPLTPVIIPVHLNTEEKRAYAEMKKSLAVALTNGSQALATNRLAQMMRLRQITAGYLPNDQSIEVFGQSKVDTIASIVNDTLAGEKRIVVFTMFVHETQQLKDALAVAGTEVLVVGGGSAGDDRIAKRKRFGSDDPTRLIMLAQVQTLSLAVNELVTACDVVFASLSQRRDDLVQAIDRLNRMGQTRPMTAWFPLAPGTIDEVIYATHQTKADLEANVIRHILDQNQVAA
jgi:SNF2 family DNA or RNA helicase